MSTPNASCSLAEEIYFLTPLHVLQWVILILCALSLILVSYTGVKYLKKSLFEKITKELIVVLYMYVALYSFSQVFNQSVLLNARYQASIPCDAQVHRSFCFFRMLGSSTVPSFIVIHIAITIQRALSTFNISERIQTIVSRFFIIFSLVYASLYGTLTYIDEPLTGWSPYCSSITKSSQGAVVMNIHVMFALDIFNISFNIFLWKYNKKKLMTRNAYDVNITFHRRQNLYSIKQFMPIDILHSFVYLLLFINYACAYSAKVDWKLSEGKLLLFNVATNVFPWYSFFCPCLFLFLIKHGRFVRAQHVQKMMDKEKDPKDVYFNALQNQWNEDLKKA